MGAEQHFHVVEFAEFFMIHCDESLVAQAFHFSGIVYNVAEAIEHARAFEFFLGFSDGSGHSEAESAAAVDFDISHV